MILVLLFRIEGRFLIRIAQSTSVHDDIQASIQAGVTIPKSGILVIYIIWTIKNEDNQ